MLDACFMSEHRGEEGGAVVGVDGEDVECDSELCGRGAVVDSDLRGLVQFLVEEEEHESLFHEGMIAQKVAETANECVENEKSCD